MPVLQRRLIREKSVFIPLGGWHEVRCRASMHVDRMNGHPRNAVCECSSLVARHIPETSLLYLYTVHGLRPNAVSNLSIMATDLTFVIGGGKCVDVHIPAGEWKH